MIYSNKKNRFYSELKNVLEAMDEDELELVICDPVFAKTLVIDDFYDFDSENEVESIGVDALQEAITLFNEAMDGIPLSWSPTTTKFKVVK